MYLSIKARYEAQLRVLTKEVEELSRKFGQEVPESLLKGSSHTKAVSA